MENTKSIAVGFLQNTEGTFGVHRASGFVRGCSYLIAGFKV